MTRRSAVLSAVLIAALGGAAFGWGFLAAHMRIFPYQQLRQLAIRLELGAFGRPEPVAVESPSPALGALQNLPYVGGTYDPDQNARGVTVHDPKKAFPGYNLYTAKARSAAYLLGMDGEVAHRWSFHIGAADLIHVQPLSDGAALVLLEEHHLQKLDRDSNVLWKWEERVHHDFSLTPEGEIWVLVRRSELVPEIHPTADTVVDYVARLSPDGEPLGEISILRLLLDSPYSFLLPSISHLETGDRFDPDYPGDLDVTHANHVEVFDGSRAHHSELFARGNFVVSLRSINTIFIADPDEGRILWLWGPGNLTFQHHPTLLDNGHLLIFDNGLEKSRVLELDPLSDEIVWSYAPEEGFFTRTRGSNQRLPNGNTLITESDTGYVFEVSPEGEIVWQFVNPEVNPDGERESIWRLERFTAEELPFLDDFG